MKTKNFILLLVTLFVTTFSFTSCKDDEPTLNSYQYEVTSTTDNSLFIVRYVDLNGDTIQPTQMANAKSYKSPVFYSTTKPNLYLWARNQKASSNVTVTILLNGVAVKTANDTGTPAEASINY